MQLSSEAATAAEAINALPTEDEKKAAVAEVRAMNPGIFPDDNKGRTLIWMTLLIGLFVLGGGAIWATVVLALAGKDFAAIIALGTAVVGGVIGLFAKSPVG